MNLFTGADTNLNLFVEVAFRSPEGKWRREYTPVSSFNPEDYAGQVDVFFSPAPRSKMSPEKNAVAGSRTLWVDYDKGSKPFSILPPSRVVSTQRGYHLYWLLNQFLTDLTLLERLNKVLADQIGADDCWNCNRILRVPGTKHREGADINVILQPGYIYSTADVEALIGLDNKLRHKIQTGDSRGYTSRSELDFAVIRSLAELGMSETTIQAIFENHPVGSKYLEHPQAEHYWQQTWKRATEGLVVLGPGEGIVPRSDGYYIKTSKGARRLSTFIINPKVWMLGENGEADAVIGDVEAQGGTSLNVAFPRSAFTGVAQLSRTLVSLDWQWLGGDTDVRALLPAITELMRETGVRQVRTVTRVGRTGEYYITSTHCIAKDGTIWLHPEGPLAYMQGAIAPPPVQLGHPMPTERCRELVELYIDCNLKCNTIPILGWWAASAVKPLLEEDGASFPILNVTGAQGSGKTTIIEATARLFGYKITPTDCETTRFTMLSTLGSTVSQPVHLAEFRTSSARDYLLRYVRLIYDEGHDPRGRPDRTIEDYPLTTPVVVDGQDRLSEPAAMERVVCVLLRQSNIVQGSLTSKAFFKFEDEDVTGFSTAFLLYTLNADVQAMFAKAEAIVASTFDVKMPHRIRRNFTIVVTGLLMLHDWLGYEAPIEVLWESIGLSYDTSIGRARLEADHFVESVVNAASTGIAMFKWRAGNRNFYFQMSSAYAWYQRSVRSCGGYALAREALEAQLEELGYIGDEVEKDGVRLVTVDLARAREVVDISTKMEDSIL